MDDESNTAGRLTELRGSARGWHGAQLAALGFIGLCGVLQRAGNEGTPKWLQILAGLLVLLALALACVATGLVASVAWPLDGPQQRAGRNPDVEGAIESTSRRLRAGVVTTFVAVGVLALAAASSWWPRPAASASLVEVSTESSVLCGSLGEGHAGGVELDIAGRRVVLPLGDVVRLRAVGDCSID